MKANYFILLVSLFLFTFCTPSEEIEEIELTEQPPQWLTLDPCYEANINAGFELYRDELFTAYIWMREPKYPYVIEVKCNKN